jgi:hypothetical protein
MPKLTLQEIRNRLEALPVSTFKKNPQFAESFIWLTLGPHKAKIDKLGEDEYLLSTLDGPRYRGGLIGLMGLISKYRRRKK